MPPGADPDDWSGDGRYIAVRTTPPDLYLVPAEGGTAIPVGVTPSSEKRGRFSPDGRWIAYMSDESGRNEIYVRPVPGPGPRKQVSTGGGDSPEWGPGPDATEIYYRDPTLRLMAQRVDGRGSTFVIADPPQTLFKMTGVAWNFLFDTHDGKQFVMVVPSERDPSPLTIVVNWTPPKR